ncbi:hypothetical protein NP233_g5666 [Leucocoprinus birnbaumii]|uniref:DUF221-domain-containing protein n=1 Tax=Leucocoprinus birnbaumii TaxID=56174 RepID=A0AAD5VSE4_9AGAR|nr:hypothetical protein NP233_g5666 [Leucocoprinus birnbaumii]
MDLAVESVTVCREVGSLKGLIDLRTKRLLELEKAWVDYVGNPSTVEEYDPETSAMPLVDTDIEGGTHKFVVPHKPRPTLRPGWFQPKVDALEYLEKRFKEADELVKKKRRTGRFRATGSAFVTFEKMSSAQIAVQTAHASSPFQLTTYAAPEPRDIVWANMTPSTSVIRVRDVIVLLLIALLFFFWIIPITALSTLLSYQEIKKAMPWLGRLIDANERLQALVQNSLPSVAMIMLNALLPFILEALTYVQGYKARSWVEYSLLKKYFLFLLVNVVFIFLFATTYWQLARDLANTPAKVPEKLAIALQAGQARKFFLSYVILQGLGIMPLQLLNLGVIIPRVVFRLWTRTPRDFAELNAPPMINYGVVYPQAILMFVITMLYSVQQPLIVIFGAIYFGIGYVVYKYKLLFVFYKPYESQGQAWPITFIRLIWGVIIFLLFMIGIFTLRKSWLLSSLLLPLLFGTMAWSWYIDKKLKPLSKFVSLSSVFEVQRGEETADVVRLRAGHPVTWSQSNLNRRRYAQNDDTLYVAPEDERTDYVSLVHPTLNQHTKPPAKSQPPMANWYTGVLKYIPLPFPPPLHTPNSHSFFSTGKRRYGHPALNGVLPEPWLPLKKGQTLINQSNGTHTLTTNFLGSGGAGGGGAKNNGIVLRLRKRYNSSLRNRSRGGGPRSSTTSPYPSSTTLGVMGSGTNDATNEILPTDAAAVSNPWNDLRGAPPPSGPTRRHTTPNAGGTLHHRLSFDHGSGVIMLPDDAEDWLDDLGDDDPDSDEDHHHHAADSHNAPEGNADDEGEGGGEGRGLEQSVASLMSTDSTAATPGVAGVASPSRMSRYGTYWHHPERRRDSRMSIPG